MVGMETTMLVLSDPNSNNNKFYEVTLDGNIVKKRWGRVGANGQSSSEGTGRSGYERAIASKKKKGYQVFDSTGDGSSGSKITSNSVLSDYAVTQLPTTQNADLIRRINSWCDANRHMIEDASGGKITVAKSGSVETALGPVGAASILEARALLDKISKAKAPTNADIGRYMTIVPQDIGRTRGWEKNFVEQTFLAKQVEFLDALDGAVAIAAAAAANDDEPKKRIFRYSLTTVDPSSPEFRSIQEMFTSTVNSIHTSSGRKLVALYEITEADAALAARIKVESDRVGNVKRLWHGTGTGNLISLMHRGLIVPTNSDGIHIAGRMFGDGVYFSDQSTKSLNYSDGYWGGGGRGSNEVSMFVADVAMGREMRPRDRMLAHSERERAKYDSINVKGGTCGVMNNEMIQWNLDRIKLTYLAVFS
jgi:poly [ADP-ribose] polymerase